MLTDMSINNDNHKLTLTLFFMIIVILTSRTCCVFAWVLEAVERQSISFVKISFYEGRNDVTISQT